MQTIENKLLTVFDVFRWDVLYQPFTFYFAKFLGGDSAGKCFQPSFYAPAIKLFVHCGDVPEDFTRAVVMGHCWRIVPDCPKPAEDNLCMQDLIRQPALLRIPSDGETGGAIEFFQFADLPGEPGPNRGKRGMLTISQCDICHLWSPDPKSSYGFCRGCAKRGRAAHANQVELLVRQSGELALYSIPRFERVDIPESGGSGPFLIFHTFEKPAVVIAEYATFFTAFRRLLDPT